MQNPVLVEVIRGGIAESVHSGAYAVTGPNGAALAQRGDIGRPIFPRSAIKALQCLPVIESGAADRFGFTDAEIALCCASHNGEAEHVAAARAMLKKAGNEEAQYECGAHDPYETKALKALILSGHEASAVHNNCSGKHAGMLALARQLGVKPEGYTRLDHPVQRAMAKALTEMTGFDVSKSAVGVDGCSVPTWAIPLSALSLAFARFASGEGLAPARRAACQRIIAAVRAHPFMVAGSGRFCTRLMEAVPRAFVKIGAEGVYCASIPHAGIGIALKCDDGAGRAAEVLLARVLTGLDVWTAEEKRTLEGFASVPLTNWRQIHVGDVRAI